VNKDCIYAYVKGHRYFLVLGH